MSLSVEELELQTLEYLPAREVMSTYTCNPCRNPCYDPCQPKDCGPLIDVNLCVSIKLL